MNAAMPQSRSFSARRLARGAGPLYRQAAAQLRAAIAAERIPLGTELPTEAALARGFDVSLITVRHALRELEQDGLIRKRAAKAAVVVASTPRPPAVRPLNSIEDVVAATSDADLRITSYGPRRSAEAASAFALDPATDLHCLRGRLLVDGEPLSEITIFFPPDIGARLTRADFDDVVVFRSVERRLGIRLEGARITVTAELADAALARTLDIEEGDPVLVSRMLWRGPDGAPVELTIARHRADRYSLSYDFP
jgi:GntR family transcriptional regulator